MTLSATHKYSTGLLILFLNLFFTNCILAQSFEKEQYSFSVPEDIAVGGAAGTVSAGSNNTPTYSIIKGNTNSAFSINSNTGAITTAKSLNRHTQSSYTLTVKAMGAGGLSDETTATITVQRKTGPSTFSTIEWSTVKEHPEGTHESQGKAVGGKLYVFGGFDPVKKVRNIWTPTKRSYVYDPVANSFASIADLPHTPNGTDFGGVTHSGIATDGTDIYFAGGYTSNNAGNGQIFGTKQVWRYNVSSNTYTALPDLPVAISAGQMEYVNGKLHHISGTNVARNKDLGDHYVLDLDNTQAGWKTLAPLPNPRQHAGSAVVGGKLYFIGGQTGHDEHLVAQKDVHVYDPAANEWKKVADLPVPSGTTGRGHITSTVVVFGERIIVLGGETAHGKKTNLVSAYTPSDNTWTDLTRLPQNSMAGVASILNNNLYYLGGDFRKTNNKGTPAFVTDPEPAPAVPEVAITKPSDKDSYKEGLDIVIEADATVDGGSITKVEFFAGNEKLGEDTELPFTYTWKGAGSGTHTLSAKATSNKDITKTSATVQITVSSNTPPTVEITAPENGTNYTVGSPVSIQADASDADGTIAKVEFFQGNIKIGEDTSAPFTIIWNDAAAGTHHLTAKATDNEGGTTTSAGIDISVMNADNEAPSISILSPENGAIILEGNDLTITVDAKDEDGSIEKVEFYTGTTRLGVSTVSPYSFTWTNIASGTWEIKAIVYDNEGASTESSLITVTVEAMVICPKNGSLTREFWLSVSGSDLSDIPLGQAPSGTSTIDKFETPSNFNQNYATRLRGYICPPANGDFTFWVSSSHKSELWLSSNDDPENKTKIAFSDGNHKDMWDHNAHQQSEPIQLKAGHLYYVEAIHLTGSGDDHFAVGWQLPNQKMERPIPGIRLLKYEDGVVTAVSKSEVDDVLKVYPVPSADKIYIELSSTKNGSALVEIVSLQGVVIRKIYNGNTIGGKTQRFEVGRDNLAPGIYFVRLTTSERNKVRRIIIN